jgi:hypothetical protein
MRRSIPTPGAAAAAESPRLVLLGRTGAPRCPVHTRALDEGPMAIWIWGFVCARCGELVLLCTRCLGRRQYCDRCAEEKRRLDVGAAGRRYQQTRRGRAHHRRRSRRYRAARRVAQGCAPTAGAEDDAAGVPTGGATASATGERGAPALAGTPERVTHQSGGPGADAGTKMASAPTVAARRVTARAEEPSDVECSRGQVPATGERDGAATGTWAAGACCGRTGQQVFFDGRLALVRGANPG